MYNQGWGFMAYKYKRTVRVYGIVCYKFSAQLLYTVNSISFTSPSLFFGILVLRAHFTRAISLLCMIYPFKTGNDCLFSVMDAITVLLSRIETTLRDLAAAGGEWAVVAAAAALLLVSAAAAALLACRHRRRQSSSKKIEEELPLGDLGVGVPPPPVAAAVAAFSAPPPPPPMIALAPLGRPPRVPGFN